jgi:hypothetical protein
MLSGDIRKKEMITKANVKLRRDDELRPLVSESIAESVFFPVPPRKAKPPKTKKAAKP